MTSPTNLHAHRSLAAATRAGHGASSVCREHYGLRLTASLTLASAGAPISLRRSPPKSNCPADLAQQFDAGNRDRRDLEPFEPEHRIGPREHDDVWGDQAAASWSRLSEAVLRYPSASRNSCRSERGASLDARRMAIVLRLISSTASELDPRKLPA